MELRSDYESNPELMPEPQRISWTRKVGAAVAVGAVLLLAPAAVHYSRQSTQTASIADAVAEFDMELVPKRGDCATDTMNCITAKCCEKSGAKCFRKDAGYAKCAMKCPGGGWSCYEEKATWANKPAIRHLDASLFCFTVYVQNKGEGLVNKKDLAILQKAFQYQESLFSCNDWEVFSDVPAQISLDKGYWSTVVSDADGTFKSLRRKDKPDHYLNTPLFIQVWKALAQQQRWSRQSFTVKVDPTTVFFPAKLRTYLASKTDEPANGYYMQNCKSVKQGFFGNLEVVSKQAMTIFLQRADSCTASCWKEETDGCKKDWKFGPWGEDLFMQNCMDKHGVGKADGFDVTTSGTCPASRPKAQKKNSTYVPPCSSSYTLPAIHPFRTPEAYFTCLGTITGQNYA